MAEAYLFSNYNSILVCGVSFFDQLRQSKLTPQDVKIFNFTLFGIYRSNQILWKIHGLA